ncbi:DUF4041 domain-containing protein [Variovorax sp. J22P168]|uniref:DUF4041 domain-containing protein n=1 Tax=Variovorax jilinensis TaxID=3053513 RepID=UPI0025755A4A|nr:DUF4041 domain-containing protein [Variovorax sp. J22P168]MDM0015094.1 DUF4041 domain-containing protein [Variovorax sp. J22P168]
MNNKNQAKYEAVKIPFFGARRLAAEQSIKIQELRDELREATNQLQRLGAFSVLEMEERAKKLEHEMAHQRQALAREREASKEALALLLRRQEELRQAIVVTEDAAMLQEVGIYKYRHPLTDAVSFRLALDVVQATIKEMAKKDGGAIQATTNWTVNGSITEGKAMVRDFSKLMLRAFNAEADNLVRLLKPYKLDAAIERLRKVASTIERLGRSMDIQISAQYLRTRIDELSLTADFLQRQAEEKEADRAERERLKEERKAQQELERERERLEKERTHYTNALAALEAKGDLEAVGRMRDQLADVDRALSDVDYRAANIRAGYVYVISNIGSFGESMVKVGMTRRLDPRDRIRELSDASVPFNFDVHALFFSKDAVGIEGQMHARLGERRVNAVNRRREFFRATPLEAKLHLSALAGELLEFEDIPEALEFRQSSSQRNATTLPATSTSTP